MKINEINQSDASSAQTKLEIAKLRREAEERDGVIEELAREVGLLKNTLKNLIKTLGPKA